MLHRFRAAWLFRLGNNTSYRSSIRSTTLEREHVDWPLWEWRERLRPLNSTALYLIGEPIAPGRNVAVESA